MIVIEPILRNDSLFARYLNPTNYVEKESRQTVVSDDLSAFAPQNSEMLNLWRGFVELVHYIDENKEWLDRELEICKHLKY